MVEMLILLFIVAIYFLPTIVITLEKDWGSVGEIFLLNALLGWTVIGWFMVLAEAERKVTVHRNHLESIAHWEQTKIQMAVAEEAEAKKLQQYKHLSPDEIVFHRELDLNEKYQLLQTCHGFAYDEAEELIEEAAKQERKAKLGKVKRSITLKAQELYNEIPVDDRRSGISSEVKLFVWSRDGGKCVQCGSNKKLEYDHIIPFSKGGSDTARNLQLLCEPCNRSKTNHIA